MLRNENRLFTCRLLCWSIFLATVDYLLLLVSGMIGFGIFKIAAVTSGNANIARSAEEDTDIFGCSALLNILPLPFVVYFFKKSQYEFNVLIKIAAVLYLMINAMSTTVVSAIYTSSRKNLNFWPVAHFAVGSTLFSLPFCYAVMRCFQALFSDHFSVPARTAEVVPAAEIDHLPDAVAIDDMHVAIVGVPAEMPARAYEDPVMGDVLGVADAPAFLNP